MASMLIKGGLVALGGSVLESKYSSKDERFFGLSPLILLGTGFWTVMFGFQVGAARKKAIEAAEKDGEKDVKERYDLPNLYAQGTSKHARAYNCVQRAHQHIFETFPSVILSSLVAATQYPIASAVCTLTYSIGRYTLSNCYAQGEGDASKRYSSRLAVYTWYGLVSVNLLGMIASVKTLLGDKMY